MENAPAASNRSPFLESRFGALIAHARGILFAALIVAPAEALIASGLAANLGVNPKTGGSAAAALVLIVLVPLFIACVLPPEIDDARFNRARAYLNVAVGAFMVLTIITIGLAIGSLWDLGDSVLVVGGLD